MESIMQGEWLRKCTQLYTLYMYRKQLQEAEAMY